MGRLDRFGDEVDDDNPDTPGPDDGHDARCRNGWLGFDDQERPRPCLRCRPWLAPRKDHG